MPKTKKSNAQKLDKRFGIVTERIIELISKGTVPWHKPWKNIGFQNLFSERPYSGINPLICTADTAYFGYTSPYFVGMGQCQKYDWRIKQGSKATWLRWGGKQKVEQEVESETGEVEVQETFISRFKWLQVFNLDCVDDISSERKIAEFLPAQVKPEELIPDQAIEQFLKNIGSEVRYGGNEAFYDRQSDFIGLPHRHQFSSRDAFYATRFHEEGHRTGHRDRLNRQLGNNRHEPLYHYEELVAELTAAYLGNEFGLASIELEHHASYIDHYLRLLKQDDKSFFSAAYEAQRATKYLMQFNDINKEEMN